MEHAGAVLAPLADLHLAAEMMRHQLHPVANPQHRNSQRKNLRIGMRRARVVNARGPPRENNSFRRQLRDFPRRNVELDDLRINLAFADPSRDDLGVLRTEIENQDSRMRGGGALRHGCISLMFGSSERSIGPRVPLPVIPRWNFCGTSCTVACSSGSAQPPSRKATLARRKAAVKAFKREQYLRK